MFNWLKKGWKEWLRPLRETSPPVRYTLDKALLITRRELYKVHGDNFLWDKIEVAPSIRPIYKFTIPATNPDNKPIKVKFDCITGGEYCIDHNIWLEFYPRKEPNGPR